MYLAPAVAALQMKEMVYNNKNTPNTGVRYVLFNDIRLCADII
jgi:hypothetical protein